MAKRIIFIFAGMLLLMASSIMPAYTQNAKSIKGHINKITMMKETGVPAGYDGSGSGLNQSVSVFLTLKESNEIFRMDLEHAKNFGIVEISKDNIITKPIEGKEVDLTYTGPDQTRTSTFGLSIKSNKVINLKLTPAQKGGL
ncbi:MAG: hypothetical protein ACOZF2_14190 [Thermodesulfobacteriota bacterium]